MIVEFCGGGSIGAFVISSQCETGKAGRWLWFVFEVVMSNKKKLGIFALALVPLAIGLAVGVIVPVDFLRDKIAAKLQDDKPAEDDAHASPDSNAVELSQTSQQAMNLTTGRIQYSDYRSSFDVPAYVREIPGASDLHVSSRFSGLVQRVLISEGQTVVPGQPILEIELTGDLLATAQAQLLDAYQQIAIVKKEIERLEPSVRSGGVASKRLIEKKYERERLLATVETKTQELLVRGISQTQIDQMTSTRKLLRTVTVNVPFHLVPPQLNAGQVIEGVKETFLVERLVAKPGAMMQLGEDLCELSFHAVLVVEGQAYEKDLPRIREAIANQTAVDISIGPDNAHEHIEGLKIAFLSNHVDEATNTYPFYLYLENIDLFSKESVPTDLPDLSNTSFASGGDRSARDYVTWKWKPGQRAHVEIPDELFEKSIVIPREALAVDGLTNYVFRWAGIVEHHLDHGTDHTTTGSEVDEIEIADKYEAVEVIVVHKDRRQVVIKKSDGLELGDRIAINNAGRLLFAM